jgi:hypothetical protein
MGCASSKPEPLYYAQPGTPAYDQQIIADYEKQKKQKKKRRNRRGAAAMMSAGASGGGC